MRRAGFTAPTPVQAQAYAPALAGHDLLVTASTGSGKTAAFLLPILARLGERRRGHTRALVIAPTRELALQTHAAALSLCSRTDLRVAVIHGGVSMAPQRRALREGADVIIACPGRLLDLMQRGLGDFSRLETLVIDEADRMLDLGFLPDLHAIARALPPRRQTLMFSATFAGQAQELARELLRDPVRVAIERELTTAASVEQRTVPVSEERKTALLVSWLRSGELTQTIVFTRTKARADRVAAELAAAGIATRALHGDLEQGERAAALRAFRERAAQVLVATDVAQRGIDVRELDYVVNYDVPACSDDYVHRAGRTGRAGRRGSAITLVSERDAPLMHAIERELGAVAARSVPGFERRRSDPPAPPAGPGHPHAPAASPRRAATPSLDRMTFDSPDWA